MPVRKIAKSYRNVTGIVATAKAAGPAQFESTLERDFLTRLEFSPHVRTFEAQPVTLRWPDGERDFPAAPKLQLADGLIELVAERLKADAR